ncbi:MAG: hypothetical protein ACYTF6_12605 [Planctomycetota bacterium]|jgi:hypothetical protein
MLGRVRRTTRTDVGLALAFSGIVYLLWSLVAGVSRAVVGELILYSAIEEAELKGWVRVIFVEGGIFIDLVGLAWLGVSLYLVVRGSQQRASISWAWTSAVCQLLVAALGSVLVGWAAYKSREQFKPATEDTTMAQVGRISLPVVMVVAVLLWTTFLVWLLFERARLDRRGPTLRDGLRTNIYR